MGIFGAIYRFFAKKNKGYTVLFETSEVWFSPYADGAFEKYFKPWKLRHIEIHPDGRLIYKHSKAANVKETLHVSTFMVQLVDFDHESIDIGDSVCIKVLCNRDHANGLKTYFRVLLSRPDLNHLLDVIKGISSNHNVNEFTSTLSGSKHAKPRVSSVSLRHSMNRSIAYQLDTLEYQERKARIIQRRGAFCWLPALFSNDLVHGSWWFVAGSLLVLVASLLVLANCYKPILGLGDDDSNLPNHDFEAAWYLLNFSSLFFTLGSMAFTRAVNDPPMKPLFKWYHFSTDELLGSWLFLLGVLPAVPYSIIFLQHDEENQAVYFGLLIVSILCVLATCLFVLACYPVPNTAHGHGSRFLPHILRILGDKPFYRKHCATDWLTGTWVIYWGTFAGTVLTFLYTLYYLVNPVSVINRLVNVSGFFGCLMFLIGSAYFVAGSYPTEVESNYHGSDPTGMSEADIEIPSTTKESSNDVVISSMHSST